MRGPLGVVLVCGLGVAAAHAGPVETSIRPELRGIPVAAKTGSVRDLTVPKSVRPMQRPSAFTQPASAGGATGIDPDRAFQDWITDFRARAMAQGIRADVLDRAFRDVRYDAEAIRRDRNQSEFTKTIWDYLDSAVSDTRIRNGKAALDRHLSTLEAIEARYGVEKEVVTAIWGLESAYGTFRGQDNVIRSMATLAYDGRRGAFFEEQLIAALTILQSGDTRPDTMTGSWAGAMGHTQFMPTSYLDHAVDFTGNGRRDIWSEDPSDALASTAAYLKHFGWVTGQPWGVEVRLPEGFDYRLAKRSITKRPSAWARLGVMDMQGAPVPDYGEAAVLLPAGGQGAAFLIFENFSVIERYNTADAYVIGVGHLSDRISGGAAIQAGWPRGDRALTYDERKELQQRLTAGGFDTRGIDGRIGPLTINAVRAYQVASGLTPDGYASLNLLKRLR